MQSINIKMKWDLCRRLRRRGNSPFSKDEPSLCGVERPTDLFKYYSERTKESVRTIAFPKLIAALGNASTLGTVGIIRHKNRTGLHIVANKGLGSSLTRQNYPHSILRLSLSSYVKLAMPLSRVSANPHKAQVNTQPMMSDAGPLGSARRYSTTTTTTGTTSTGSPETSSKDEEKVTQRRVVLSKKERLKIIARDYGKTVIVFHIGLSLVSLGLVYTLISRLVAAKTPCTLHRPYR
jgi:hypothetical protein